MSRFSASAPNARDRTLALLDDIHRKPFHLGRHLKRGLLAGDEIREDRVAGFDGCELGAQLSPSAGKVDTLLCNC